MVPVGRRFTLCFLQSLKTMKLIILFLDFLCAGKQTLGYNALKNSIYGCEDGS
jgi:hypothetical protein